MTSNRPYTITSKFTNLEVPNIVPQFIKEKQGSIIKQSAMKYKKLKQMFEPRMIAQNFE